MKRVLIITYYWPPAGGSGVQRWLKFSKYLPQFGWQPVIYTPANPEVPVLDASLEADVPQMAEIVKTPIVEPYDFYRKLFGISRQEKSRSRVQAGSAKGGKGGWKADAANFVRANFFIPDPRFLWIRPSVKYLAAYLKDHPVDAVISTGPPHSMHLIARRISHRTGLPWIADFRDPWTGMFYFKHLKMLPLVKARHRALERKVIAGASAVVVVTRQMREDFLQIAGKAGSRVEVITNGYDSSDFKDVERKSGSKFTIVHTGLLFGTGNPRRLWQVLGEMCDEDPVFRERLEIRLIGETDPAVFDTLRECGLMEHTVSIPYLPHAAAVGEQKSASVLLLTLANEPEAKGILTGKFFEYLASGRPILAIAPTEGDLADAIRETHAGNIFGFNESEALRGLMRDYFEKFLAGTDSAVERNREEVLRYDRKSLTAALVKVLESLQR